MKSVLEKLFKGNLLGVIAIFALALISLVLGNYLINFPYNMSTDQAVWGQFGDYFGGVLNPILSFFALIGLLFTLRSQQIESKRTSDRHKEQVFESRLFQLLSLSHSAVSSIKFVQPSNPPVEFEGHRAIGYALNRLQQDYFSKADRGESSKMYEKMLPEFNKWKNSYWSAVASYLESMQFLIVYVVDNTAGTDSADFSIRAVFAQMTSDEKLLMFYVMMFSPREKILLTGAVLDQFFAGASPDDFLFYRKALLQSAVLARLTPA